MRPSVIGAQLAFLVLLFFGSALVSAIEPREFAESEFDLLKQIVERRKLNEYNNAEDWREVADEFQYAMNSVQGVVLCTYRTAFELATYAMFKKFVTVSDKTFNDLLTGADLLGGALSSADAARLNPTMAELMQRRPRRRH